MVKLDHRLIKACMNNYITLFYVDVITYSWPDPNLGFANFILMTIVLISVDSSYFYPYIFLNTKLKSDQVSMNIILPGMDIVLEYVTIIILPRIIIIKIYYHQV